jgi:dipeptidyl aminopeptidase/acylaminoacyl peptidase
MKALKTTMQVKNLAFGKWPSLITPELLADRVRLGEAQWKPDNKGIIWLQSENGRGKLSFSQTGRSITPLTRYEFDVRGTVGYGGGEFAIGNDFITFANRDGRLYRQDWHTNKISAITPSWGSMASPAISPNQRWVLFVFCDGERDLIGAVNSHGHGWPMVLASGSDFYMQPVWHPGGDLIAWVEWDNPYLPWQASRVKMGEVGGMQIKLFTEDWVAGDERHPATHPQFSPDGKWLSFIHADGDWDQLMLMRIKGRKQHVLVEGEGVSFGNPGWVQGQRFYGWSADSQKIYYRQVYGGKATLWEASVKNGKVKPLSIEPYTWISQLDVSKVEDKILMQASSPHHSQRLVQWKEGIIKVLTKPSSSDYPMEYLPNPIFVQWQAENGTIIHGVYYPPSNPKFFHEGTPPLIVEVHAGPTMNNLWVFVPERAFFTSRGYAVIAVDYRGSSGYGRTYQDAIYRKWGILDVRDSLGAAQAMVAQGLADPKRLAIIGSSAGGFTVLNALIQFPGFFKAGVCAYPVCDLMDDMHKTHKLERYYNHYLIGDPGKDRKRYLARSPLLHAENIQDPIAIFHGENDHVVSIEQSRNLVEIIKKRGTPYLYQTYPEEGHGFRKPETISDYYQKIEAFLNTHFLI